MEYLIRRADAEDAPGACETVRRSIAELCVEDHGGDPTTIAAWLANKTVRSVESWIASPTNIAVVAATTVDIVGFALMSTAGRLAFLYVSPEARFQGVSKALMTFLEREASRLGIRHIRLESSATARQFYADRGFASSGGPSLAFGRVISYPMSKTLAR
jgi:GNAT superfamily N-acetyltransferase